MTVKRLCAVRKILQNCLQKKQDEINKKWGIHTEKFIADNIPLKKGKVYELLENGIRRRGFKRFCIYSFQINFFKDTPLIRVGGWWLDETDTPAKWDFMTVYGVSNPAKFETSKSQKNNKVPKHLHHLAG